MAGYSGTPLVKKLGIKEGMVIYIFKQPAKYLEWLSPLPDNITIKDKLTGDVDFVHSFVSESKLFQKEFLKYKKHLKKDGMLWISWPKKLPKCPQTWMKIRYVIWDWRKGWWM